MDENPRPQTLTPRELEILVLIAGGLTSREIAASLGLSHRTVQSHVGHVLTTLHAHTRAQAVAVGYQRGWLT